MQVREPIWRTLLHFLSGGRERGGTPKKKAADAKCAYRQGARQKPLFLFGLCQLGFHGGNKPSFTWRLLAQLCPVIHVCY